MTEESLDIIVPEFNELSRQGANFDSQLEYFAYLSKNFHVILVDDASVDGSWARIAEVSMNYDSGLETIRMEENGRKILAIKRAAETSNAEYVLLTDFDSRLITIDTMSAAFNRFEQDPWLAGLSLRVVPDGNTWQSKIQDLEYAIGRGTLGRYLNKQNKSRCVTGAGGIWRRRVLLEILEEHSGRHNGDDMEATAIAMRKGYHVGYESSVLVKTFVPQNFRDFYNQRRRWDLGALETYEKEHGFYTKQIKDYHNRLGQITILDWYSWITTFLLPYWLFTGVQHLELLGCYELVEVLFAGILGYVSRKEFQSKVELLIAPLLPFYRIVQVIPRLAAVCRFLRGKVPAISASLGHLSRLILYNSVFPFLLQVFQPSTTRHFVGKSYFSNAGQLGQDFSKLESQRMRFSF